MALCEMRIAEDGTIYEYSKIENSIRWLKSFEPSEGYFLQKAEIEGYGHLEVILNTAVDVLVADIKSKEIKKFAERLEDDLGDVFMVNHPCVSAIIDKLVKEMTEEQK